MENENQEVLDNSLNNQEAEQAIEAPEQEQQTPEIDIEALQKRAKLADDYKIRAERAEKRLKTMPKEAPQTEPQNSDLSGKDILFFSKTELSEEDVDEVVQWSRFKGITPRDAYTQLKPSLDIKAEQRRTAAATATRGTARGTSKDTGEEFLRRAEATGEVPTTVEEVIAMKQAKIARMRKK